MKKENKINLVESTILALQGKLEEKANPENKEINEVDKLNRSIADLKTDKTDKVITETKVDDLKTQRKAILQKAREKRKAKVESKEINKFVDSAMTKLVNKRYSK